MHLTYYRVCRLRRATITRRVNEVKCVITLHYTTQRPLNFELGITKHYYV